MMKLQDMVVVGILVAGTFGCASKTVPPLAEPVPTEAGTTDVEGSPASLKAAKTGGGPLICKARKSKFHFDWHATSPNSADGRIDQNSVSFDFRAANRPAGARGENLKVGECGWAAVPMSASKKEKSRVSYKRLSDEATETFYKIHTGKVFQLPVRQGKNGLSAVPGAPVTVIR
jgi:hypothetical protein